MSAVVRKFGFATAAMLTDWPAIVGPELAERVTLMRVGYPPGRKVDGTLHVQAGGSTALELQHREQQILERINRYFGYRAVARITVHNSVVNRSIGAIRSNKQ